MTPAKQSRAHHTSHNSSSRLGSCRFIKKADEILGVIPRCSRFEPEINFRLPFLGHKAEGAGVCCSRRTFLCFLARNERRKFWQMLRAKISRRMVFFGAVLLCVRRPIRADYGELIKVKFKSPLSLSASPFVRSLWTLFFREHLIKRTERAHEIQSALLSATSRAETWKTIFLLN